MQLRTEIIPKEQRFIGQADEPDYAAICFFAATGFFLDRETYFKGLKVLKPATDYEIDQASDKILSESPNFEWFYKPEERSFERVVDEFAELFESVMDEQLRGKAVILPLSGGLDSRTQAVALKRLNIKTNAFSYAFKNGLDETRYGKRIAQKCGFPFKDFKVPNGYLWDVVEDLATINKCYSEFTHPRQMAFIDHYASMGNVFSLGHWGDVLFDDMGAADDLAHEAQVELIIKKIVKKGGAELAQMLWKSWGLDGDFNNYLKQRISELLNEINIPENANARIRAFKSLYWAPRWTSINLSVFSAVKAVELPYYDRRMCEFICSVPESYLAGRKIQIAYIKKYMPELAKVTWQAQRPFNLYNYKFNRTPWNLPYRIWSKLNRSLFLNPYVQRNWELQFLGRDNDLQLRNRLFDNPKLKELVDDKVPNEIYRRFKEEDAVYYSHPVSMLLTFSLFSKMNL